MSSCYERFNITGTLPKACYATEITSFPYARGIGNAESPRSAELLRDRIRERAPQVCKAAGIEIEHVSKCHLRKDSLVVRAPARRGAAPGLVNEISAMEACWSYKFWLNTRNEHVYLRADQGKFLHDYLYFIHEEFRLSVVRVST